MIFFCFYEEEEKICKNQTLFSKEIAIHFQIKKKHHSFSKTLQKKKKIPNEPDKQYIGLDTEKFN